MPGQGGRAPASCGVGAKDAAARLGAEQGGNVGDPRLDAARNVAGLEAGKNVGLDDGPGGGIRQRAFQAVADLDAHAMFGGGNDQ